MQPHGYLFPLHDADYQQSIGPLGPFVQDRFDDNRLLGWAHAGSRCAARSVPLRQKVAEGAQHGALIAYALGGSTEFGGTSNVASLKAHVLIKKSRIL